MGTQRTRVRLALLLTMVLGLLAGCGGDQEPVVDDPDVTDTDVTNTSRALTADDYRQAIELKNRGLAALENMEWADAEQALTKLAELLPDNQLALRNLAIARVLSVTEPTSPYEASGAAPKIAAYRQAVARARTAIDDYQQKIDSDYDQALADLLLGKLLVHSTAVDESNLQPGLAALRRAADRLPRAADFRYALAAAMEGSREYADSPELLQALQQTFQLAPENLFAVQRLLQKQALNLNSQDPAVRELALQVTDTMRAAQDLLTPLNESIKKQRNNIDLIDTLEKALRAYDGSNPAVLMGPASMTSNLLNPENATLIDQRRLNKSLLEYVLWEFDSSFLTAAREAGGLPAAELPPVVIESFTAEDLAALPNGITALQAADFDLDGFEDLSLLRDGRFEVWSRGADPAGNWTLLVAAPEAAGSADGFLLADIDRDYDPLLSELKSPQLLRDRDGDQKIVEDPAGQRRWFDTDLDVVLWGTAGVTILRNELDDSGQRQLTVVPQPSEVTDVNSATAADVEADGDLDLIFATASGVTLWQNTDRTTFANINDSASLPQQSLAAVATVDWDRNVAMDVLAASAESGSAGFLENMLHGRFRWRNSETGLADLPPTTQIAVDQLNGTGNWDVVAGGSAGLSVTLINGGAGQSLSALSTQQLTSQPVSGFELADFDNDTHTDIFAWSQTSLHLFRGRGDGGFEDISSLLPGDAKAQAAAVLDYDDDGDLDIVLADPADSSESSASVLLNQGGNANHWITVVARGKPDDSQFESRRVNAHAIGAVIEVRCGTDYQAHVIDEPVLHIGLGDCQRPDAIRIIWTDGIPQNITVPELLRPRIGVLAPQILLGSCPYIYTWTGERFEFFSDCLWAAPIGLVQANGEIAPTREWENLLIPGSSLAERDGRYLLQLTEELWEAAYFDQVELLAIDHPADVQIFTNEKVGPPDLAAHRIHTVRNPELPVSVTDGRGTDLLPGLTAVDGNYVQAFRGRVLQGLTDEWTMEFDLGPAALAAAATEPAGGESSQISADRNLRLFLTGWIFPTDTSLNLAIQQDSALQPPAPPVVEVPDPDGGWRVARPFIGFPSGKTKAMVVDLTGVLSGENTRFRLRSTMELYWDAAFFTVGEQDAQTVTSACVLERADLHFRGFSRRTYAYNALFRNGRAPEGYDYDSVTTAPRWPAMSGRFTRYGQVLPLLQQHDDQLVVMGAGDELTLEFQVPAQPLPDGWTRDFVLRNVGYDKDANLNTIYGQSSEPFPFQAMTRYPFAADAQPPSSLEFQAYLNQWQTRTYAAGPFWNDFRHGRKQLDGLQGKRN